ncbi:serine hydrolase [Flavobacterium sp. MK4S-17]|uniref:serine hydrolase domain-containing protein n=1 Tax=Flavobacterium sp. MK4S-17 TaxID=2543737 RepID=UPI00135BF3CC|nr:serine hydrolase domain-containing protein [Flavobacterium sp. MK4S-17]
MKISKILPYILALSVISCKKEKPLLAEHKVEIKNPEDTVFQFNNLQVTLKKLKSPEKKLKEESIKSFYEKNWPKDDLSGGFLVAKNGQVIYETYGGYANRSTKEEITADTPLHIASVSKVFTAAAIMKLIDGGKLELDQKVNTILPTFPYKEITIKMLLNHRSGLPNYAYFCDDRKIWNRSMLHNQDILNLLAKHKFNLYFKPDRKFGYCNTNYAMLALVIEKITGNNYRDAMQKMLFEPLGMKNTYVFDYEKHKATASRSYKGNNVLYGFDFLDDVYGDKNIYSTPRDLLKFDLANYCNNFLDPDLVKKVFRGYSYEHKGVKNYGLGIRLHEWKTGEKLFYHNGWWHGNTSSYVTLKKDTVVMIALSNKFSYKPYKIWKMATLFGSYPIEGEKDDAPE